MISLISPIVLKYRLTTGRNELFGHPVHGSRGTFLSNLNSAAAESKLNTIVKNGPEPPINLKPKTGQRITLKTSPQRYSHVTLVSGYPFLTAVN